MNIYDRLLSVDFSTSREITQRLETLRSADKSFFASRVQVGKLAGLTVFDAAAVEVDLAVIRTATLRAVEAAVAFASKAIVIVNAMQS